MYAVIFKATIKELDDEYSTMAGRMRELAMNTYGCTDFTACTEGNQEIAISYWPSKAHIQKWRDDSEHKKAQALGKSKWYQSYQVEVVEIVHQYKDAE